METKRWFSESEAAEYTGVPKNTLRKERYARKIRYGVRKNGRSIIYDRKDLDEYILNQNKFYKAAPADNY